MIPKVTAVFLAFSQNEIVLLLKVLVVQGRTHSTQDSIFASHLTGTGSNPSIPKILLDEILKLLRLVNGTALNIGQRLDNCHRTHLVLASDKLAL